MFSVEIGHDYSGYSTEGVWAHENLARLHARQLRREERGDSIRISSWQGRNSTVVAEWNWEYTSYDGKGHREWFFSKGQDDPLAFEIREKPYTPDPAFLEEMGLGS